MTNEKSPGITKINIGNVPKNKIVAIIFKYSFTSTFEDKKIV